MKFPVEMIVLRLLAATKQRRRERNAVQSGGDGLAREFGKRWQYVPEGGEVVGGFPGRNRARP